MRWGSSPSLCFCYVCCYVCCYLCCYLTSAAIPAAASAAAHAPYSPCAQEAISDMRRDGIRRYLTDAFNILDMLLVLLLSALLLTRHGYTIDAESAMGLLAPPCQALLALVAWLRLMQVLFIFPTTGGPPSPPTLTSHPNLPPSPAALTCRPHLPPSPRIFTHHASLPRILTYSPHLFPSLITLTYHPHLSPSLITLASPSPPTLLFCRPPSDHGDPNA